VIPNIHHWLAYREALQEASADAYYCAVRVQSVGVSDAGRRRINNEDAFLCDDQLGFYVVADGVGGRAKGEVASRETVEQLRMWVRGASKHLRHCTTLCPDHIEAVWEVRRLLESAVQSACYMVFGMSEQAPARRGMSTTVSALLVGGGFAFAAHVGDSRVYRVRGEQVLQMTEDHTLINYKLKHGLISAAEAEASTDRHVITRAVGQKDHVQVDTVDVDTIAGDRFLLCTDGLHSYLRDRAEVAELMGGDDMAVSARAALALANERGGQDNITAVFVSINADR
jgi:serine/threonine protein phosphatase PrpC